MSTLCKVSLRFPLPVTVIQPNINSFTEITESSMNRNNVAYLLIRIITQHRFEWRKYEEYKI